MTKKPKAATAALIKTNKNIISKVEPKQITKLAARKVPQPSAPLLLTKGAVRVNSKQVQLVEMLRQPAGVNIQQIMDVTGWQQHSVRGFLSGTIKEKLGLTVITDKTKDGARTYRIKAA